MKPYIIQGGNFEDHRGKISFVNDFSFENIRRFYTISNSETNPLRAWQGHKLDCKNFFCTAGSFKIFYVEVDDWQNPSKNLLVECTIISASDSKVLVIPAGFANAVLSLEPNSQMISFSTLPLSDVALDDVRFDSSTWCTDL